MFWVNRPMKHLYESLCVCYEIASRNHGGRKEDNQPLNVILKSKDRLCPIIQEWAYTHVELLRLTEYPFDGSWGYQPVGLYAVTFTFGTPWDFKVLGRSALHQS